MEQLRILLAIVLSFLVFFLWNMFFSDKEPARKTTPVAEKTLQTEAGEQSPSPVAAGSETPTAPDTRAAADSSALQPVEAPAASPAVASREITVDTPLFSAVISTAGADFKSMRLKNYRETVDPNSPLLEMVPKAIEAGTVQLSVERNSIAGLSQAVYSTDIQGDSLRVSDAPATLSLSWTSADGMQIEKQFTFFPRDYRIALKVLFRNGSGQTFKDSPVLSIFQVSQTHKRAVGFEGPSALIDGSLNQIKVKDLDEKDTFSGKVGWIALQDRYFMSAIIPPEPVSATFKIIAGEDDVLQGQLILPEVELAAGAASEFEQKIFIGPKSVKLLSDYGQGLSKAIDFGWFDIVAKPCVYILNFIYDFIPNYGIAIIILTLITKVLLWPLGQKSYKSMAEMKKLQPLIADLREKYKNDKKKLNEETMNLYRTYKVNPMGGCLPMVVQIPIFIALYRMLYETIELRHAPFFGWINDLSAPDRLFHFNFSIPFMEPPYGIPVLTLIMGATMFLQQKMSPPMGDATQAKMMMLMPVVFTFIFINFSSGLVLYWLVNNVFSILQQYFTTKRST